MRWPVPALTLFLFFVACFATSAGAVTFGAMGDSLTDEYLGTPSAFGATDLPALSWVQLLAEVRGLDFGAFEADPDVRGEPRNEGYAYNWARSGATALANPLPIVGGTITDEALGFAPAVEAGEVDVIYLGIGANDYGFRIVFNQGPFTGPEYQQFEDDVLDAIFDAVDTLQEAAANGGHVVDIILGELPLGTAFGGDDSVLAAIAGANSALRTRAADLGLATVDLWAWTHDDSVMTADGYLKIGDYTVHRDSTAALAQTRTGGTGPCTSAGHCATLEYALNFIAHDTIHPNTIVQGMLANEFLEVVNQRHALDIPLLTDDEILHAAVPEPGTAVLLGLGLGCLGLRRDKADR